MRLLLVLFTFFFSRLARRNSANGITPPRINHNKNPTQSIHGDSNKPMFFIIGIIYGNRIYIIENGNGIDKINTMLLYVDDCFVGILFITH